MDDAMYEEKCEYLEELERQKFRLTSALDDEIVTLEDLGPAMDMLKESIARLRTELILEEEERLFRASEDAERNVQENLTNRL